MDDLYNHYKNIRNPLFQVMKNTRTVSYITGNTSKNHWKYLKSTAMSSCRRPLPVWDAAANELGSGEDSVAGCDSPGGTSIVNFKH